LFIPNIKNIDPIIFKPIVGYSPLYIEKWLKGYPYYQSSDVVKLVNFLKSIFLEGTAKRIRL